MNKQNLMPNAHMMSYLNGRTGSNFAAEAKQSSKFIKTKAKGAGTEHTLISSDLEVYCLAGLSLLKKRMFADALRILDTGFRHLNAKTGTSIANYEKNFDSLIEKVWLSEELYDPILAVQLDFAKAILLYSIDSPQSFKSFSALTDYYRRNSKSDISERLYKAYQPARRWSYVAKTSIQH